jgi:hypothetical protein
MNDMKKFKRYIYISLVIIGAACTDDITSLNVDPKAYTKVPGATLMSNATKNLVDAMTTPSVNSGIFRLLAQQWTETTYTDESRYDLGTRNIPQNFWNSMYRDVLRDLKEAKKLISADNTPGFDPAPQLATIDILEVYSYSVLVNTFGDIPYTEALDADNLYPKYDDAATIYDDLITRLDADIAALNGLTSLGFPTGQDLIYANSAPKWAAFANSLKLRLGMTLADVNPTKAKTVVEQAAAGPLLASNADNAKLKYLTSPPNTNQIWVNLVQSGRQDFVAANTIVDMMNTLSDPRRPQYFTFDQTAAAYSGGLYGTSNNYGKFSKPAVKITAETFPGTLLDYSEVEFYLAEAAARGFAVGGTAEEHYNAAITASILDWGGTQAEADAYLLNPAVAYSTAAGDFRQKIGTQKWIALYNRGFEAWTEQRRFDYPALNPVANPIADFPSRFLYPTGEQNLNTANFTEAASRLGGDLVTKKVFWDTL